MRRATLEKRIEALEARSMSASDADVLRWSEGVTDAELSRLAGGVPGQWLANQLGATARHMTDAQLWKIVLPRIERNKR
jgi:hypothetical protein